MGGLSRRAQIIKQIISEENKPVLILDGGALLFEDQAVHRSLLPARTVQARGIARAVEQMKYTAVNIAPQDLAAGTDFLNELQSAFHLPFVSANLVDDNGLPIFKPYIMSDIAGITVAIIGLTAPGKPARSAKDSFRIFPWQEALEKYLPEILPGSEMIILLSSYPEPVNREIAEQFADLHLIIQSGTQTANRPPRLHGNTLITQTGSRGKYAGRLDIDWAPSGQWNGNTAGRLKQQRERLDRTTWQLGRLEKRYPEETRLKNEQYQQLLVEQSRLKAEIERQEPKIEQQHPLASFTGSFIPLQVALPEDPKVKKIVDDIQTMINSMQRLSFETPRNQALFADMAGVDRCRTCHVDQTEFWSTTRHAEAWQTLIETGQQFNRECLICHVTLPAYDKQTVLQHDLLAGLPQEHRSVSCEACHGPGGKHAENPAGNPFRKLQAEICLTCHTPEQDDQFNFLKKKAMIACPGMR